MSFAEPKPSTIPLNLHVKYIAKVQPQIKPEHASLIKVPGVQLWSGNRVATPPDSAARTGNVLRNLGYQFTTRAQLPKWTIHQPPRTFDEVHRVLQAAPIHRDIWQSFAGQYQRAAVAWLLGAGSGSLWHPPGSGKTLCGVMWAVAQGRNILVITRAIARPAFKREFERVTTIGDVWYSDPSIRTRVQWETMDAYMQRRQASGQPAVVVVAWEELAWLTYGDEAPPSIHLTDWPGVGEKLADQLLRAFGSLDGVRKAPVSALARLDRVGPVMAERLAETFAYVPPQTGSLAGCLQRWKFDTLLMDEIHQAKDLKRRRYIVGEDGKMTSKLRTNRVASAELLSRSTYRHAAMTGTPVPNTLIDLWGQLDLVLPDSMGTFNQFGDTYCAAREHKFGKDRSGSCFTSPGFAEQAQELRDRILHVVHYVPYTLSHSSLPPRRREVVFLTGSLLGPGIASILKEIRLAKDRMQRFELELAYTASRKRPYVIARALEHLRVGRKVVIFTGRREDARLIQKDLRAAIAGVPVWLATGEVSASQREVYRKLYMNACGAAAIVATGDAMGEGVDLQDTDLMIMAMLPWTPRQIEQWEQRVHRRGQTREVTVLYPIVEGSVEDRVHQRLLGKLPMSASATGNNDLMLLRDALEGLDDLVGEELLDSIEAKIRAAMLLDDD